METTHRTIRGGDAVSILKTALEAPGRPGRLVSMLTQLGWRRETMLALDGAEPAPVASCVEIDVVDQRADHAMTTTVTALRVAGIAMPVSRRSRRLAYRGRGRWTIGQHVFQVTQPEAERQTFA